MAQSVDQNQMPNRDERPLRAILVADSAGEPAALFDAQAIFRFVRDHWIAIAVSAIVGGCATVAISYAFPRIYRAEVLLTPTDKGGGERGLEALISKYGALASAAGIDLPNRAGSTAAALARLQSRGFLEAFIQEEGLMDVLYPGEWDPAAVQAGRGDSKRTLQDGYHRFARSIMLVKQDKAAELVTIRVDWKDRKLAAKWANLLVKRLNAVTRAEAIQETERSLEYLRAELERAEYVRLKDSISSLIEAQINKRMMAVTQPDYSFRVIDPARPSDANKKIAPKRIVFLAVGVLLGAVIGILIGLRRRRMGLPDSKGAAQAVRN
jgi:uncharacterized protein involved in exopolysaccharide biosynthesis